MKTLFALLVTHKENRQSFAQADVQIGSSSRTFHPEATGAGGKVQSKKIHLLKRKLLHLHLPLLMPTIRFIVIDISIR